MLQRNIYNEKVSDMVACCHRDIVKIMQENDIRRIIFSQHEKQLEEGIPFVTFNDADFNSSCVDLGEVLLNEDGSLNYISCDLKFSGYTDGFYGDYFDVAQSLPKIYAAICDIVNAGDVKDNERG